MLMCDYHVHPDYSPDARGSIREYCLRAWEVGVAELCFTTHYELDPERAELESVMVRGERRPVSSDWASVYFADIEEARGEFEDLIIRAGVELGYEMGIEGLASDFLGRHEFDFVLGAVHCLEHVAISGSREVARMRELLVPKGAAYVANRYFDYLHAAAGSGLFDCLAHLDIYRKYALPVWRGTPGEAEFVAVIEERLDPVLEHVVACGVGIEVNSSALRRGDAEPYPCATTLRRAWAAGVRTFTTGSDAHRPEDLGVGLDRAVELLAGLGVKPARFERRHRVA